VFLTFYSRCGPSCEPGRLARFRTGGEGRISHLKRAYSPRRSRLRGLQASTPTNWAIIAYNTDNYGHYATASTGGPPRTRRSRPPRQIATITGLDALPSNRLLSGHVAR
jgi:hypothetical protein